ncbi:aminotransferase class I/II-fold pyridoxal phosphate-dependent enzyme [Conexibacter sp. W3-3-2]|uniref:MocR-like pyridoxine biosynthesis transcription factor PdxR n=1 Tax=Conexibacter sp. W3-3-2 TaxID=2675227 RepID=UPI0012B6C55A|nr:PLP-dependent aminotransferase family protein [Conexibacter sp. W3-3-2]MTD44212.1 aminotransferase class I/II-fold pyridoxal phosphate-dependent enzyme [Conexibacter sp. W3-3-2]
MPLEESNRGPEVLLAVRRTADAPPLGAQVEAGLRAAVRDGRLRPGDRLPPSRTLARDLGVSRRLVVDAYDQLVAEAWLEARVGAGTFVRRALPAHPDGARAAPPDDPVPAPTGVPATARPDGRPRIDFFPGHPDLAAFPRADWQRATRAALRELPDAALGYADPRGLRELRVALAALLARTRGVVCRPGQIVLCQGVVQALGLLVRATAGSGRPVRVAVEDPYLHEHRDVLHHAGAEVVPVPVDELGVRDEAVAAARPDLALVTPAHQCPTGVVLAAGRRAALARWAERHDALLVEDDYDAEYRYDRAPVAALQALAPRQVVYLGSTSKTLAPGLRLAWMVVPEDRLAAVVQAKRYADGGSPVLEQAAFARLLAAGAYDRHVRAARRRQRGRRDALVAAVARELDGARVDGVAAGLHALVRLPAAVDAAALVAAARARDVGVYPLSAYRADPPARTSAVVLGYGALGEAAIAQGVRGLAAALREVR